MISRKLIPLFRAGMFLAAAVVLPAIAVATPAGDKLVKEIDALFGSSKSELKFFRKEAVKKIKAICDALKAGDKTPQEAGEEAAQVAIEFANRSHRVNDFNILIANQLMTQAVNEGNIDSTDFALAFVALFDVLANTKDQQDQEIEKVEKALAKLQKKIAKQGGQLVSAGMRAASVTAIPASQAGDAPVTAFSPATIQAAFGVRDGDTMTVFVGGNSEFGVTTSVEVTHDGVTISENAFPTTDGTFAVQFGLSLEEAEALFAKMSLNQSKDGGLPWTTDTSALPIGTEF